MLTRRVIFEVAGKTRGRKERLRGHIGVKTRADRDGWTMGPPALREYAVDPVGVETMSPSDCRHTCRTVRRHQGWAVSAHTTASVKCCPSTNASIVFR